MNFEHVKKCLLILLVVSAPAVAQTVVTIDAAEAQQHLIVHVDPVYPPIAQVINMQGDVVVSVVIDTTGQIISAKAVSGPPMLRQAASEAVKQWRFNPFETNGAPTQVTTTLTVPFHIENQGPSPTAGQEKAAQAWFPLSDKCRNALKTQNAQDSLDSCKQALDMSLKAGDLTSSDQLAMLDSRRSYGHALLLAGKLQEALAEEDKAIEEAKAWVKDTDENFATPFYWRAMVEARMGQGEAASADLTIAEETYRRAIANLPVMKKMYSQSLASILQQHAALLDQMGQAADADKLRSEASSL